MNEFVNFWKATCYPVLPQRTSAAAQSASPRGFGTPEINWTNSIMLSVIYIQIHLRYLLLRAFRFKNKRQLKNLMIIDQGGCPHNFPGVGDVSYIKDLITEEIVSRDFSCSIFGPYSHPIAKIGWVWMIISFSPTWLATVFYRDWLYSIHEREQ